MPSGGLRTIVIDAGHGGHDGGCKGSVHGSREKHIALAVALDLGHRIREAYPDVKVIFTRETDVFVPLHERAATANRAKADLFVSIHCNAMPPGAEHIHGSETYVMGLHTAEHNLNVAKRENAAIEFEQDVEKNYDFDPNSPSGHIILSMFQHAYLEQSLQLASKVEEHLGKRPGVPSRGVKQAGFLVLKETAMPSVLIEIGYLTHRDEERYLAGKEGQQQTVEALFGGLSDYMQQFNARLEGLKPISQSPRENVAQQVSQPPAKAAKTQAPPPVDPNLLALQKMSEPAPNLRRTATPAAPELEYFVQLAASSSASRAESEEWKSLGKSVRFVREGSMYKYQAGPFFTRSEADAMRKLAREREFKSAFIVAYRNGQKLSQAELDALP